MEIDPENSSLYAKRSLCFLNTGHEVKALEDATTYKDMQPDLSKSCYVHRAALLLVEVSCAAMQQWPLIFHTASYSLVTHCSS